MRILVLILTFLMAACVRHDSLRQPVELPRYELREQADVRFSPDDWPQALYGDLYVPQGDGPHAAVLMVHGGGWERRSRHDMDAASRLLSRSGLLVFNIDYRFAPEYRFPAQLQDLQLAMRWLHDNAQRLQIDAQRIGAVGFSSGGHLVSLLATVAGSGDSLDEPHGGSVVRPAAVVVGGAPTDLSKYPAGRLVPQFVGGTRDQVPERFAMASPVSHIHEQVPPFFFFHGSRDRLVPLDHATDMIELLEAQGVDTELYLMRGRGHVSSFVTSRRAFHVAAEFLHHHLNQPSEARHDPVARTD